MTSGTRAQQRSQRSNQRPRQSSSFQTDLVQPAKPNKAKHQAALDEIRTKLDGLVEQRKSIEQSIKDLLKNPELDELRARRMSLKDEVAEKERQLSEKLRPLNQRKSVLFNEQKELLSERERICMKHKTVESVDAELSKVEYELATARLTKDRQKQLMREVDQLKLARLHMPRIESRLAEVSNLITDTKAQISAEEQVKAQLAGMKDELRKLGEQIRRKNDAHKEAKSELPALEHQKAEINKQIDELIAKRKQMYEEWNTANEQYKVANDQYHTARKAEQAKFNQERKKAAFLKEAERKAADPPFFEELRVCDLLLSYLNSLKPKPNQHVSKSKKSKKKSPKLALDFECLHYFSQVNLSPPLSIDAVDETIKAVTAKKEEMLSQVDDIKAQRVKEYQELLKKFEEENPDPTQQPAQESVIEQTA
ncbi:hypothetical protein P9112_007576 [Eukaryota sp. TZLM1-RC]